MKNEDMPVYAQNESGYSDSRESKYHPYEVGMGETKFEKAFWQVYSAMIASPATSDDLLFPDIAAISVSAVNDGFKALESRNKG